MNDPVNYPAHYQQLPSGIEVIDITEGLDFLTGNIVKYVLRAPYKGEEIQDLEKAAWYLQRKLANLRAKTAKAKPDPYIIDGGAPTKAEAA